MTRIKTICFSLLLGMSVSGQAQTPLDSLFNLPDTVRSFSIENFYGVLLNYHPLVKQAYLLSEGAQQELRLARGSFDPKLESTFSSKQFQEKEYYSKWAASLSIPVWFPVDPKIGFERNTGTYVNPESAIPSADNYQQWVTSIRLPVGRGLMTDDRRAAIRQAQLFQEIVEAEQIKLINKILLEAAKDYWHWYFCFYNFRLLDGNTRIAAEVLERIRLNASLGEASSLDTIQAKITWQQRQVERQEAYLEFLNQSIKLSNYLWDADALPIQLSAEVVPVIDSAVQLNLNRETLDELVAMARQNHPDLRKLSLKLDQLEVDRKLAAEYLKPRFDVTFGLINQPIGWTSSPTSFLDHKLGADFSIPIFLRKERSKLAQTKLKIRSAQLERSQAERDILNQLQVIFNQLENTRVIIDQQTAMAENYKRLLAAELLNLQLGESDLFKINVQQEKVIQSLGKLVKLQSEYEKMKATLYWAAGIKNLNNLP